MQKTPLDNDYCTVHQHCAEVMQWGASLDYPQLWVNPHLWIEEGKGGWEAFAECYTGGVRRNQVIAAIAHYKDGVATWHV